MTTDFADYVVQLDARIREGARDPDAIIGPDRPSDVTYGWRAGDRTAEVQPVGTGRVQYALYDGSSGLADKCGNGNLTELGNDIAPEIVAFFNQAQSERLAAPLKHRCRRRGVTVAPLGAAGEERVRS